jgi:hypothetical protein
MNYRLSVILSLVATLACLIMLVVSFVYEHDTALWVVFLVLSILSVVAFFNNYRKIRSSKV